MRFLSAEADALQQTIAEFKEPPRRERTCGVVQAIKCRLGRGQRDLLLENDVHKRWKARLAHPKRRRAVSFHHSCQIRVALRQFAHALREGSLIEQARQRVHLETISGLTPLRADRKSTRLNSSH